MTEPTVITVHVVDRAVAFAFYDAVFGHEAHLAINVLEGQSPASPTPVCELVVDDIDRYIALGVQHGAELCTRLAGPDGRGTYAQWRDPFGYLWAFAVAS